jgi:hypothetical protein
MSSSFEKSEVGALVDEAGKISDEVRATAKSCMS